MPSSKVRLSNRGKIIGMRIHSAGNGIYKRAEILIVIFPVYLGSKIPIHLFSYGIPCFSFQG